MNDIGPSSHILCKTYTIWPLLLLHFKSLCYLLCSFYHNNPLPCPHSLYIVPCTHSLLLISYFHPLLRMPLIWLIFSTGKATTSKYKYLFRHHIFCVLPVSPHLITHCLQNVPRAHIISPNPNTHNYSNLFLCLLICFKLSFL